MNIRPTLIEGVHIVDTGRTSDDRGSFARLYCERELADVLGDRRIVQINHSRTTARGAVRGMHFQRSPHSEMKMVRCLAGRVWDVAVDLRANSPTFLQWHAEELSAANGRMLVVPEGCAHGFQTLEDGSELLYLHTAPFEAASEGGVGCSDARLAITWPLPVSGLSARDASHPPIGADFVGLTA